MAPGEAPAGVVDAAVKAVAEEGFPEARPVAVAPAGPGSYLVFVHSGGGLWVVEVSGEGRVAGVWRAALEPAGGGERVLSETVEGDVGLEVRAGYRVWEVAVPGFNAPTPMRVVAIWSVAEARNVWGALLWRVAANATVYYADRVISVIDNSYYQEALGWDVGAFASEAGQYAAGDDAFVVATASPDHALFDDYSVYVEARWDVDGYFDSGGRIWR